MEVNSLNSLSKKTCFSLTSVFYDICKSYMEEHSFHHVCYVRLYTYGSQINLTTHPEWVIDFIIHGFADNLEFMHDLRSFDKTSYFIFSLANQNE